jgi:flagellar FliL protein
MASDKNADKDKDADKTGAEGEGADAPAKPKGRFAFLFSKKILMIAGPVLLLLIGGGVYYFMFMGGDPATADGDEAAKVAAAAAAKPVFFEVPDILVNVASNNGKPVFLKLAVSLELAEGTGEEATAQLEPIMPRVVDQLQTYLRELRIEDLSGSAAMFRLKEELLRRVNLAADPIKVKSVLFREMIIQ